MIVVPPAGRAEWWHTRTCGRAGRFGAPGAQRQRRGGLQPAAEAIDEDDLPALFTGNAPELTVGVDRHRMSYDPQHRQV
ncbi:MAG TPA: hypothetical protein VIL82_01975 [Solirubrobacteraceae bacterium]|jgi:hypothetical protein